MSKAKVKIVGAVELEARLRKLSDKKKIQQAVSLSTGQLRRQAQAEAHFRRYPVKNPKAPLTGELRRSISYKLVDDGLTGIVGATKEYAPYVEFGTRKMRAQPFLKPALDKVEPKFKERVKNALK